jgi:lysyl-tRNA synthetase class II
MSDNESNKDNKSENDTQKNFHTKTEISINSNIILLNHTPKSHNIELREEEKEIQKIIENNLKIENEKNKIKEQELNNIIQIQKN